MKYRKTVMSWVEWKSLKQGVWNVEERKEGRTQSYIIYPS